LNITPTKCANCAKYFQFISNHHCQHWNHLKRHTLPAAWTFEVGQLCDSLTSC